MRKDEITPAYLLLPLILYWNKRPVILQKAQQQARGPGSPMSSTQAQNGVEVVVVCALPACVRRKREA